MSCRDRRLATRSADKIETFRADTRWDGPDDRRVTPAYAFLAAP